MAYIPELVSAAAYRRPISQTWEGSLHIPIVGGTHAQKNNPTGISFSKTGSYTWSFWIKFDADDDVYRQLIVLGTLGTNGYRIVKDRSGGNNVICLQEASSNFTAERWRYPTGFDITQWHHVLITWVGNSSTSVTTYCYINGIWTTTKAASITWTNAVATSTPLIFGYDWADHTIGGYINDIGFFDRLFYPDDVFGVMNGRSFTGAIGLWNCEDGAGETVTDSIGDNDLAMFNSAEFVSENQSWTGNSRSAYVTRSAYVQRSAI